MKGDDERVHTKKDHEGRKKAKEDEEVSLTLME